MRGLTLDEMNAYNWTYSDITPGALAEGRRLPGLRGLWANSFRSTTWYDQSGFTNNLTLSGLTVADVGIATSWPGCLMPYVALDGTNDYAYIADNAALSITGDMTIWAIVWPQTIDNANIVGIVSKFLTTGNVRSYALYLGTGNRFTLRISQDGGSTNMRDVSSTPALTSAQSWHFVCARFQASTSQSIYCDGTWNEVTTSIPTGIYDNARNFEIGQYNESATNRWAGRIAQVGICAYYVPTAMVEQWYSALKPDLGHV